MWGEGAIAPRAKTALMSKNISSEQNHQFQATISGIMTFLNVKRKIQTFTRIFDSLRSSFIVINTHLFEYIRLASKNTRISSTLK